MNKYAYGECGLSSMTDEQLKSIVRWCKKHVQCPTCGNKCLIVRKESKK